eukprot:TRINITY_DN2386_c0_g1_i1.p4 TRINITY_DN2386_c0_g1~~TRINITY_DN2386_c0_g1_i1.p4  ORF type:complete len:146 (+),score=5.08 TRINITY_DN2386_c0_g1_i1:1570-2007(+)
MIGSSPSRTSSTVVSARLGKTAMYCFADRERYSFACNHGIKLRVAGMFGSNYRPIPDYRFYQRLSGFCETLAQCEIQLDLKLFELRCVPITHRVQVLGRSPNLPVRLFPLGDGRHTRRGTSRILLVDGLSALTSTTFGCRTRSVR